MQIHDEPTLPPSSNGDIPSLNAAAEKEPTFSGMPLNVPPAIDGDDDGTLHLGSHLNTDDPVAVRELLTLASNDGFRKICWMSTDGTRRCLDVPVTA